MKMWKLPLTAACGVMIGFLTAGCVTPNPTPIEDQDATPPPEVRLMSGDELEITFFGAPELNSTQRIRQNGRIGLHLVGEIAAAGRTVSELEQDLLHLYKGQIQIQSIRVFLRIGPAAVVSGAVMKPGRVELTRPLTALEAVMAAGGFDEEKSQIGTIVVVRHDGKRYRGYRLDVTPALAGEQGRAFYLQPNDIVYVPRNRMWR